MTDTNALKKHMAGLYASYIIGAALLPTSLGIVGCVLVLGAIVFNSLKKGAGTGTIYESHLRWLSRTFWIVNVYYLVTTLLGLAYVMSFTSVMSDITVLREAIGTGDVAAIAPQTQKIQDTTHAASVISILIPSLWWIYRCTLGLRLLKEGRPVENVTRWV